MLETHAKPPSSECIKALPKTMVLWWKEEEEEEDGVTGVPVWECNLWQLSGADSARLPHHRYCQYWLRQRFLHGHGTLRIRSRYPEDD